MISVKKINCAVLVNDPVEIEILQMALDDIILEIDCRFFTDCGEMIRLLKKQSFLPDCIILDSDFGDIGRKDCLKKIKNAAFVASIPVVIFAGLLSELEKAKLTDLGTHSFISKANSVNELKINLLDFFNTNFDLDGDLGI